MSDLDVQGIPPTSGPNRTHKKKIDQHLAYGTGRRRSTLSQLLRTASLREAWTAQVRALLPTEVAPHVDVASQQDGLLSLHADSAAWATRLRFLVPTLLPRLRPLADFAGVKDIRIRVAPNLTQGDATMEAPAVNQPPSPPDARSLQALADSLEYDQLKAAILRLAQHAGPRPGAQSGESAE